jgi:lipopolysaccharide transport system ATP-binding protein
VAFSGVEKFIDTPVKRYSSGMRVRLAFSVAAHLDPEILLVDEVLAVGDASFQKKCLGKMDEVAGEGRTVMLVSHNMSTIKSLCAKVILLDNGCLVSAGFSGKVISNYLETVTEGAEKKLADLHYHPNRLHKMDHVLQKVLVKSSQSELCDTFMQSDDILIEIHYDGSKIHESLSGIGFILELTSGVKLGGYNTYMAYEPPHSIPQVGKAQFVLQSPKLIEGRYFVTVSLGIHQHHLVDKVARAVYFDVLPDDIYGTGFLLTSNMGIVSLQCDTVISGSTS